jgi:hypothetical protein
VGETYQYLLGEHGVFEGTPEDVLARGFDPWQAQLFSEAMVPEQFGRQRFTWSGYGLPGGAALGLDYATGYLPALLDLRAAVQGGTATDEERARYQQLVQAAQAIPLRDASQLTYDAGGTGTGQTLSGASPDLGGIMLRIADRIDQGTATAQERQLLQTTEAALREQDWRASVPQPSDAFNPLGDEFFQALNALTMAVGGAGSFGAFGAAGAAGAGAGAAGGSVLGIPTSTLATIGTVGGYGAQGAGMLGSALQQPWLTRLAGALGAASGLAGGVAGLGNLAASGVQNVSDVGRLLQSTGRVTGALGAIPGADPLRQAGRYLGLAGQVGRAGGGAGELFQAAQDVQQGATQGGRMGEWDWLNLDLSYPAAGSGEGYGVLDPWSSGGGAMDGINWNDPTQWPTETPENWYRDVGQYIGGSDPNAEGGGAGWLSSVLGSLGQVGSFLGKNAGWLGPAVSGLAGLGAGALGSQAARDAAGAQTDALNRALELQTAQWLQQQANQAPWLEAGRAALGDLTGRAQWAQPTLGSLAPISGADYALPGTTPGWTPQAYGAPPPVDAAAYRWIPGQGPRAADYRYTPGAIPAAADYRYTPGAVPTLRGQELLANDPGYQFRQDEARRALEASALARGSGMSGATLSALGRQSQELASQEYGNAWQRAAEQARLREAWAQTASQLGFGQAMDETRLREQVNQVAAQQGWTQAQAEAAFREQMAQHASAQNWQQALAGQQSAWTQGLQAQQWGQQQQQAYETALYGRQLEQAKLRYGQDWQQREAEYQRMVDQYNALRQGQNTAWNQFASLAGYGQTAVGQLGTQGQNATNQLSSILGGIGTAQASGMAGGAQNWMQALGNINTGIQGTLNTQSILGALQSLNR